MYNVQFKLHMILNFEPSQDNGGVIVNISATLHYCGVTLQVRKDNC